MAPVGLNEGEPFRRVARRRRHASRALPMAIILLLIVVNVAVAQVKERPAPSPTMPGAEVGSNRSDQSPAGPSPAGPDVGDEGSRQVMSSKAFGDLERVFPQAGPSPAPPPAPPPTPEPSPAAPRSPVAGSPAASVDVGTAITETAQPSGAWSTFTRATPEEAARPPPAITSPQAQPPGASPGPGRAAERAPTSRRPAPTRSASLPPAVEGPEPPRPRVKLATGKPAAGEVAIGKVAAKKAAAKKTAPRWIPLPSILEPTSKP